MFLCHKQRPTSCGWPISGGCIATGILHSCNAHHSSYNNTSPNSTSSNIPNNNHSKSIERNTKCFATGTEYNRHKKATKCIHNSESSANKRDNSSHSRNNHYHYNYNHLHHYHDNYTSAKFPRRISELYYELTCWRVLELYATIWHLSATVHSQCGSIAL